MCICTGLLAALSYAALHYLLILCAVSIRSGGIHVQTCTVAFSLIKMML